MRDSRKRATLVGVVAVVIGLLPWLVTGARLPLQNLWATQTLPEDMPLVLLPLSQYFVTVVIGLLVVGSGAAALGSRLLGTSRHRTALVLVVCHLAVVAQSFVTLARGHDLTSSVSLVYVAAVAGLCCCGLLLSLVTFWTASGPGVNTRSIGLTLVALALAPWLTQWGTALFGVLTPGWLCWVVAGIPVLLVGVIVGTGGRVRHCRVAWVVAVVLVALGPTLQLVSRVGAERTMVRRPLVESLDLAVDGLFRALLSPWALVQVAVVLVVGLVTRTVARHVNSDPVEEFR